MNHIKAFLFDVDGVLTQSELILMPDGSMTRVMNTRDGYAMKTAIDQGYLVGIITGGKDQMVKSRLNGLGITDVYLASRDKVEDYNDFYEKYQIDPNEIVFMGDDIPDMEVMKKSGLGVCPKDAAQEVLAIADYISPVKGGKGCVRDIIEQVLKVQGKWMADSTHNIQST